MAIAKGSEICEDELSADEIRMVVANDRPMQIGKATESKDHVPAAARNVQIWFKSEEIRTRFYNAIKRDKLAEKLTIRIDSKCDWVICLLRRIIIYQKYF